MVLYVPLHYDATGSYPGDCMEFPRDRGCHAIQAELLSKFAPGYALGICYCRPIAGTNTLSTHGQCRGCDWGFRPYGSPEGWAAFYFLVRNAPKLGISTVIYHGLIFGGPSEDFRVRPTNPGTNPHPDHVHFDITKEAAATLTRERVRQIIQEDQGTQPQPPQEEEDMTPAQFHDKDGKLHRVWVGPGRRLWHKPPGKPSTTVKDYKFTSGLSVIERKDGNGVRLSGRGTDGQWYDLDFFFDERGWGTAKPIGELIWPV